MYKDMLPIGSVVLLKEAEKRLMICGRIQTMANDTKIYDYSACYYPEGITGSDEMIFFDRDAIDRVYFLGFQDAECIAFEEQVLNRLGELEVVNGQIVPKQAANQQNM